MKSLVVEDNKICSLMMKKMLSRFGAVVVVDDGEKAIRVFKETLGSDEPGYDLICLDNHLPGLDGQDVLEEMRRLEQNSNIDVESRAKIFMCSASNNKRNILQAFKADCDAYLFKPVDPHKLLEVLKDKALIC
jgi:two-component system, chemotaxis family, chemotaxis protein CheY